MEKDVLKQLRLLNNSIRRFVSASPTKKEVDKVTGTHGWIIGYLMDHKEEDVYQRDLEREFSISRSTTSKMIDCMESKGLVERVKVACDDRLKKIVLTDKSLCLAEKIQHDNEKIKEQLIFGFTPEEIDTLLGFIERMEENIRRKENME